MLKFFVADPDPGHGIRCLLILNGREKFGSATLSLTIWSWGGILMNTYVEDLVSLSLTWIPFSFIIFLRKKNNILVQEVLVLVLVQSILWCIVQKPNSWTYNHGEVFGHNLESAQTRGFCMVLLNHSQGDMLRQFFLLSPLQKLWNRNFQQICRGDCE